MVKRRPRLRALPSPKRLRAGRRNARLCDVPTPAEGRHFGKQARTMKILLDIYCAFLFPSFLQEQESSFFLSSPGFPYSRE
jgi:hypothetical protein